MCADVAFGQIFILMPFIEKKKHKRKRIESIESYALHNSVDIIVYCLNACAI